MTSAKIEELSIRVTVLSSNTYELTENCTHTWISLMIHFSTDILKWISPRILTESKNFYFLLKGEAFYKFWGSRKWNRSKMFACIRKWKNVGVQSAEKSRICIREYLETGLNTFLHWSTTCWCSRGWQKMVRTLISKNGKNALFLRIY